MLEKSLKLEYVNKKKIKKIHQVTNPLCKQANFTYNLSKNWSPTHDEGEKERKQAAPMWLVIVFSNDDQVSTLNQ